MLAEAILMDESGNWLKPAGNLWGAGWQLVDTSHGRNLTGLCDRKAVGKHDHQPVREQPWLLS